jgi:hypothetical protein
MAISIGDVLGGLGAAIGGTGQQYVQGLQQREQTMSEQKRAELEARQKAMYQDAGAAFQLLQTGDLDGIIRLGQDRLEMLKTFPDADPSDTARVVQNAMNAKSGDPMALRDLATELTGAYSRGLSMGVIQPPAGPEIVPGSSIVDGQVITRDAQGNLVATRPQGFEAVPSAQYRQLSAQESAQLGLPADKQFQQNVATGQVTQIGGSGTTVNVNQGQEPLPGQKKLDEIYAQEYYDWNAGGGADTFSNIAAIGTVLGQIERGDQLTGPAIGLAPDWVNALVNPEALDAKQRVEEVVQRNLRVLLGAQFTEREGERLIARAFDARLGAKENAARLRKLMTQMKTAADQKEGMSRYFEQNGTLMGYRGPRPNVNDFYSAISGISVGEIIDGFKYTGGDPGDPNSWVKE